MSTLFLSYPHQDRPTAEVVYAKLVEMGYAKPFLDDHPDSGIRTGALWNPELFRKLRLCKAVIVLCSEHWLNSQWCWVELGYAKALGKSIFPVLIDDSPNVPSVVAEQQVISLSDSDIWNRLRRGLAGILSPENDFPFPVDDINECPYPGLPSFEARHAGVFFGRDDEILELRQRLDQMTAGDPRLLFVVGASGSGKSSLLKAGLVPRLKKNESSPWCVLSILRWNQFRAKGRDWAEELAIALLDVWRSDVAAKPDWTTLRGRYLVSRLSDEQSKDPNEVAKYKAAIGTAAERFIDDTKNMLVTSKQQNATPLMVIDQFEEILSADDDYTVTPFLDFLGRVLCSQRSPWRCIATVRSDFLTAIQTRVELIGWKHHTDIYSLSLLSPERFYDVICGPAEKVGITFEPDALVNRIVGDTGANDALPLLAFALRELYERSGPQRRITLDEYTQLEGLEGCLGRVANELLSEPVEPKSTSSQEDDRKLHLAFSNHLVRINDEDQFVRQTARWSKLPQETHPLLQRFIDRRLITSRLHNESDPDSERVIEVAHEALFRRWDKLARWLDERRDLLRWRRDVERDRKADPNWSRLSRSQLTVARAWRSRRGDELNDTERAWIDAGIFRQRMWFGVGSSVAVTILLLAIMALVQKYQADVARAEAEYQTGIAQAQRLTADANALWNGPRRQGIRALLLAIEAHKRLPTAENARVLLEMNRLLPEVVGTFSQGTGPMALSPSADRLFVGRQNAVHVFAVADGRALAKFSVPDSVWILHLNAAGVLLAVARGPDHSHLTDTSPSTVEIRRTSDLVTLRTVAFNRPVLAMNFAANDALVATDFSTVKSIGGAPGADSEWHINGYPSTVAISNSGQTIAVALGQTIHLLSTPSGKEIRVISSPRDNDDLIEDLVFSADDRFLLSSTLFADSRIWDLTNPHAAARTIGKKIDAGGTLIWSPDSKRVAQLGVGSNLCVWNAKDGKAIAARLTETEPLFGDFAPGAFFLSPEVILAWSSSNAGSLYTLAAESQIVENNGRLNHAEVKYQLSETQRMVFDGHILQLVADERRGVAAGCSAAGDGAIWKLASGSDEIAGQIRFSASGNFFQQMHRKSLSIYKTDDSEQRDAGAPPTWTSDRELGLGEFSADDKYFAASDDAGVVRLYDTKSFAEVTQVPSSNKKRREIRYVPAADVFVIAGNGKVTELSPRTLKSRERLAYPNRDNEVFSSKARFFATWDKSRSPDDIDVSPEKTKRASLAVYDLEKNERLWEVRVDSPSPEVEFSMDESLIATAVNKDTAISVWSTATGERRFLFETQTGGRFKFSPNAQYLAATDSTVIRVWDLRGGSRLFERTRDAGQFGDVAFSSDGGVLAARSGNETVSGPFFGVNVWSIPDGDEVMRFPFNDEIDGIDFTRSGRHVLVSRNRSHGEEGSDDRITSWLLWSPQDLISEAEKRKTRDLTQEEWERYIPTEPVPPNLVKDN